MIVMIRLIISGVDRLEIMHLTQLAQCLMLAKAIQLVLLCPEAPELILAGSCC